MHPAENSDVNDVLIGASGIERCRVARFLLEVCGPLFRTSADPLFVAHVRALVSEVVAGNGLLMPRCTLGSQHLFCEGSVPKELEERLSAVLISAGSVHRVTLRPRVMRGEQRRLGIAAVGLVLERSLLSPGALVVLFGERGLVCRKLPGTLPSVPTVHEWFSKHGEKKSQQRHYLLECLARSDFRTDEGALLLRELQLLAAPVAVRRSIDVPTGALHAAVDTIVGCKEGVFVSGRLIDPHRLAEAVIVERDGVDRAVSLEHCVRFRHATGGGDSGSTPSCGFAFFVKADGQPDDRSSLAPVRLALGLRSGARIGLGEGPDALTNEEALAALLSGFPAEEAGNPALLDHLEPAVTALTRARHRQARCPEIIDLGSPPRADRVSLILSAGSDAQRLRCQMGLFAVDPVMAGVEILYLSEELAQGDAAMRLLDDLRAAYGLALRLVRIDRGLSPGAALNAGSRLARGELLAFLGPDVVPEAQGWLGNLVNFISVRPQRAIVGGQPLYEDHSLVAAGIDLMRDDRGQWTLHSALGGFPRDYRPASVPSRVTAVTPDCLVLRRSLLKAIGGFDEDRLLPAAAVADLCLSASAENLEVWRLPSVPVFRLGGPGSEGAPSAVCGALDARALARRWQAPEESASFATTGRRAPQLRLAATGRPLPPSLRAA